MKIKPILFSTEMVQAKPGIYKTQTRRVIKPQPDDRGLRFINRWEDWHGKEVKCPYGQSGDILWVRETWHDGAFLGPEDCAYIYKASENGQAWEQGSENWKWKPSIFMPKEACRIFLRITDVRVERLQDISEEDAIAEGIKSFRPVPGDGPATTLYYDYLSKKLVVSPIQSYRTLWESINGPGSWEANPWVWVISFKRCEKQDNF